MTRSLLGALAISVLLTTTAHADIPYWQARDFFLPYARAIVVDPTNSDIVYVSATNAATPFGEFNNEAGTGVFRTTDGGDNFVSAQNGLGTFLVTSLAIDPLIPTTIYAGMFNEGVSKSTNSGTSWSPITTGLTNLDVYSLAIDPVTPTTLFAGTGSGIFRSIDGGASWSPAASGFGTVYDIAIDPSDSSIVYYGGSSGVRKSVNGGVSFSSSGLYSGGWGQVRSLVVDTNDSSILLAAVYGTDSGIWRSTDAGATWTHASTGLLSSVFNQPYVLHMTTVEQDPVTPGVFYASGTHGFFRSIDGGVTWANFAAGLSREYCPAIATHPDGTVYAGSSFGEFHRLQVKPSGVNHFRCFKAAAKGFVPQSITLDDRFGTTTTTVLKPVRYCTPTDPMGEGVVDATSHLVCYKTAKYPFTEQQLPFLSQRIDGYRGYSVKKQDTVCVPATAGVPAAAPRDAYRCVDGPNWRSNGMDFTISDAYGTQLIRRHKTERFCAPAGIDGELAIEDDVDLRCDSPKGKAAFTRTTVTTTDRFGTLTLKLIKPDTHCFQALESRQ